MNKLWLWIVYIVNEVGLWVLEMLGKKYKLTAGSGLKLMPCILSGVQSIT